MSENLKSLPEFYQKEIEKAIKILKENGAKEVFLFGSMVNGKFHENSDIDLAVKGLQEKNFFKVASILNFELKNQIDLVDLDDKENRFSQMILKLGGLLKVG